LIKLFTKINTLVFGSHGTGLTAKGLTWAEEGGKGVEGNGVDDN
jgi:hypothetical protein